MASLQLVIDRIQTGTKKSAIIVERRGDNTYNAFFADTAFGYTYLKSPLASFVGVFFGDVGAEEFRRLHRVYNGNL